MIIYRGRRAGISTQATTRFFLVKFFLLLICTWWHQFIKLHLMLTGRKNELMKINTLKTTVRKNRMNLRFILIGERFFHNFRSLEIIGDMYQYTEAFWHYSWNSPEPKISSSLPLFQYLEKNRLIWKIEKLRENMPKKSKKKLSEKKDP